MFIGTSDYKHYTTYLDANRVPCPPPTYKHFRNNIFNSGQNIDSSHYSCIACTCTEIKYTDFEFQDDAILMCNSLVSWMWTLFTQGRFIAFIGSEFQLVQYCQFNCDEKHQFA